MKKKTVILTRNAPFWSIQYRSKNRKHQLGFCDNFIVFLLSGGVSRNPDIFDDELPDVVRLTISDFPVSGKRAQRFIRPSFDKAIERGYRVRDFRVDGLQLLNIKKFWERHFPDSSIVWLTAQKQLD
jgi:hypothetical protein